MLGSKSTSQLNSNNKALFHSSNSSSQIKCYICKSFFSRYGIRLHLKQCKNKFEAS